MTAPTLTFSEKVSVSIEAVRVKKCGQTGLGERMTYLGQIQDKKAYKAIKKCLNDENEEVRNAAEKALSKFDFNK